MNKQGKVWLVGAGPSDEGLLTIKGKTVLQQADVVVYDKLVGYGILNLIPLTAKKINVGKTAGSHPIPQEKINQILLEEAQKGQRVVRLKGGDPFVFGRGGEELELLVQHQIPFEIVPGVTSAVSVAAYAGIPITHRDYASSFHVITAHKKHNSKTKIDYQSLTKLGGTLVFLMGVGAVAEVCEGLLKAGMNQHMPAAILEQGTTAYQRRVVATISDLAQQALKQQIQSPAIIVVGEVCKLSERFHWAEDRPLGQRRVIVTRPKKRASVLAEKLRDLGAEVVELPTIQTRVLQRNTRLGQAFCEMYTYSWIVFTSVTGVEAFFQKLIESRIDVRTLSSLKFAAIGSATKQAIEQRGILVEYMPLCYDAHALAEGLAKRVHAQEKVLIPRALHGTEQLTEILARHQVAFDDVPIYETVMNQHAPMELKEQDIVAFTSASTVKGFVQIFGTDFDYTGVCAVCIGEQTAQQAKKYQMNVIVAKEATIDSMIETIKKEVIR